MAYDFDTVINRRNTGSVKWNIKDSEIPMWVADMDFPAAPEIREAVEARAAHGIFGYATRPKEWAESIIGWYETRHHFHIEPEWLDFCAGVVPAAGSIIRKLTTPGESVALLTPNYNAFYPTITGNGRNIVESELIYENGAYSIDFEDLEAKLALPQVTLMIVCNPHNPIGRIWSAEELGRIGELCKKHHVVVFSDEIHCDLTDPDTEYVPFASVSDVCRDNCVITIAPTKTFNLASIQSSAVIVPNVGLRNRVFNAIHTDGITGLNAFAAVATITAYSKCAPWLDELREYIYANKCRVGEFLAAELPMVKLVPSQATYLLWLDCSALPGDKSNFAAYLREKTGLFVSSGASYGKSGRDFLRVNIACPRATLDDGLARLKAGTEQFIAENK